MYKYGNEIDLLCNCIIESCVASGLHCIPLTRSCGRDMPGWTEQVSTVPENYEKFVNLVRTSSNKNIARGCRTSYVCGLNDQSKDMYEDEDYQRRFAEDPFNEDTVRVGDALLDEFSEAQRKQVEGNDRINRFYS